MSITPQVQALRGIIPPSSPTPAEIRAEIERLGMSQAAFARELRVEPRTVERWLSGERTMPPGLFRLAQALPLDD